MLLSLYNLLQFHRLLHMNSNHMIHHRMLLLNHSYKQLWLYSLPHHNKKMAVFHFAFQLWLLHPPVTGALCLDGGNAFAANIFRRKITGLLQEFSEVGSIQTSKWERSNTRRDCHKITSKQSTVNDLLRVNAKGHPVPREYMYLGHELPRWDTCGTLIS